MRIHALVLTAVLATSCAQPSSSEGQLIENHSDTSARVQGLLRTNEGAFVRGSSETFRAKYDVTQVKSVEWSASAGELNSRGDEVTWTLPNTDSADLTFTLTLDNAERIVTVFSFELVDAPKSTSRMTASEALLTTPMPVVDGGTGEVSGGACDVEYDGAANVHIVFTSAGHPALYYGRWNGTAWALEVVDTLGFNTGGRIDTDYARIRVSSTGVPHLVYVRDAQVWYATKTGTTWTRERIDTAAMSMDDGEAISIALHPLNGRPTVAYTGDTPSYYRVTIATRTAANTWSLVQPTIPNTEANSNQYVGGELLFNAAGTAFLPVRTANTPWLLVSWNGTTATSWELPSFGFYSHPGASGAWAGTNRLVYRANNGIYDISLGTPISSSTFTMSAIEDGTVSIGDIAWSNGRPLVLHQHGSYLELITPATTGAAFWTWQQMGSSAGVMASMTLHPTTGAPSICYQSLGRVMFQ